MADNENASPVPADPDQGIAFGHFMVPRRADGSLWELGRGSMGVTYRAFDTSLRIEVALKVITSERVQDSDARRRFQREARAAARIRHPNVASVLYLGEQENEFFYAMEFIAGVSLASLLKTGNAPLPVATAVALAGQAAAALNAAHRREVVHRDLKPANLMLLEGDALDHEDERTVAAGNRQVKMIDFGLARSFSLGRQEDSLVTQTLTGFIGTPSYASPEQCSGEGNLDGRSDLYSLGVILWQMLTGRLPFGGRVVEVLGKHQFQPPPFEQLIQVGVPDTLVEMLRGLLAKAPGERFPQTASDLRTILDHTLYNLLSGRQSSPVAVAAVSVPPETDEIHDTTTPLAVGATLFSRYRLGDEVGNGDGGQLFLAADNQQAGLRVGLKLLPPRRLAEAEFCARLETALDRARRYPHPLFLEHPAALQRSGGATFYVREWAEGFSLAGLLRVRTALRAAEVRLLLATLPAALDHAAHSGYPLLEVALHKVFVVPPPASGQEIYGDWPGLRSLSVEEWPAFSLKVNPVGFPTTGLVEEGLPVNFVHSDRAAWDNLAVDATRVIRPGRADRGGDAGDDPASASVTRVHEPDAGLSPEEMTRLGTPSHTAGVVAAFAGLIRALLGGQPDSLAPLSALDGKGNAILRRAQTLDGSPAAYPDVTEFAAVFFAAVGETASRAPLGKPVPGAGSGGAVAAFSVRKIALWSGLIGVPLLVLLVWLALRPAQAGAVKPDAATPQTAPSLPPAPTPVATPVATSTPTPAPVVTPTPVATTPPPTPTPTPTPAAPVRYQGETGDDHQKYHVTIDLDADRKGGIFTYNRTRGDIKVRFTVTKSEDLEMQAETAKEALSLPPTVKSWEREFFTLYFAPDESEVTYQCTYPPQSSKVRGTLRRQGPTTP